MSLDGNPDIAEEPPGATGATHATPVATCVLSVPSSVRKRPRILNDSRSRSWHRSCNLRGRLSTGQPQLSGANLDQVNGYDGDKATLDRVAATKLGQSGPGERIRVNGYQRQHWMLSVPDDWVRTDQVNGYQSSSGAC